MDNRNDQVALGCLVSVLFSVLSLVVSAAIGVFFGLGFGLIGCAVFIVVAIIFVLGAFKKAGD